MSPADLRVEVRERAQHTQIVLTGELDQHGEAAATAALEQAAAQGRPVVLDLRGLDFIDSSGLRLVLDWSRRLQRRGVAFSIVRGAPHVQRPFASAGVDGLLPFVDGPPA